jgi:hypothetical protein
MTTFLQNLQSSLSLSDSEIEIFLKDKMTELIHFIELVDIVNVSTLYGIMI